MSQQAAGEPLQEQLSTTMKNYSKMQKFVSNLAALQQKMTERMEAIETEHTKMTMKYNGFREDYMRLINEQVDMRTASHKDEFISLDELRTVKIAIKEIDIKLKTKLDIAAHTEECGKREREHRELEARLRDEIDKMRGANEGNFNSLKKADLEMQNSLELFKKDAVKLVIDTDAKTLAHISELRELIKSLNADLQESKTKAAEIQKSMQGKVEVVEQQLRSKKDQEHKKFTDFEKRVQDSDRRLRSEVGERFESLSIAVQSLSARESSNSDKQLKQLSSLKVKLSSFSENMKKTEQKFQEQYEMMDGSVEGLRELYNTEHSQMVAEMSNLRDSLEMVRAEQTGLVEKMGKMLETAAKGIANTSIRKGSINDSRDGDEEAEIRDSQTRRRGGRVGGDSLRESLDKNQKPNSESNVFKAALGADLGNITSMQSNLSTFKTRLNQVQVSMNILREMIDSKVNQSEVLKLQQNKCNKYAFKDLVMKLQVLKTVLQKTIPNCQGLKQLNFDDTGIYYATLSRLSTIRSKQQNRGQDSSKSKQKEKNGQMDKRPPSSSRLPNMLSRSRKRYLTFFDRSDCQTPQELRAANYT